MDLNTIKAILDFIDRHPRFLTAADFPADAVTSLREFYIREQAATENVDFA